MSFNLKGPIWMLILISIMFENTLKMSHLANLTNIIICFLKEIGIWKYLSLTKIVENREIVMINQKRHLAIFRNFLNFYSTFKVNGHVIPWFFWPKSRILTTVDPIKKIAPFFPIFICPQLLLLPSTLIHSLQIFLSVWGFA